MHHPSIFRHLELNSTLSRKSVLLLGPRQVGKSTYLKLQLQEVPDLSFSLLDQALYLDWMTHPSGFRQTLLAHPVKSGLIVIDEIQRLPSLLNDIHLLIEEHGLRFLLTGSSARKLRNSGTNLLGGRAAPRELLPFTAWELGESFSLEKALNDGLLPSLYFSDDSEDDARSYVGLYLKEEILAEGASRNLPAFVRFLEVAAHCHAKQINFTSIASDTGVSRVTVQNYFQILSDTLIGDFVEPYQRVSKRKAVSTPKFYFFDNAIVRSLRKMGRVTLGSSDYGDFFEHFLYHHLKAYVSYKNRGGSIHFWRSTSQFEVDFVLNGEIAIECKATSTPSEKHLKGLKALAEEGHMKALLLVCQADRPLLMGKVQVLPWRIFLERLWNGEL